MDSTDKTNADDSVRQTVEEAYGRIARGEQKSCCGPARKTSCCGESAPDTLAQALGYSAEQLAEIPEGANLGLSCGNPTALASLKPGEAVLDLGSGGGFDVFVAAARVGATGRAIGVDMTPDMLRRARANAEKFRERNGFDNVEFLLGEIEHLPLPDNSVDVVISNCVINLSPDKPQVWREIFRVLKPGGRVAVSDLALLLPLPDGLKRSVEALVGCIAGAELVSVTESMLLKAGFADIRLEPKPAALDAMTEANDPLYRQALQFLPAGKKASDYVTSLNISARKPGCACSCR